MNPDPYTALVTTLNLTLWVLVAASEDSFRLWMTDMAHLYQTRINSLSGGNTPHIFSIMKMEKKIAAIARRRCLSLRGRENDTAASTANTEPDTKAQNSSQFSGQSMKKYPSKKYEILFGAAVLTALSCQLAYIYLPSHCEAYYNLSNIAVGMIMGLMAAPPLLKNVSKEATA